MTPELLRYLCDPVLKQPLQLLDAKVDGDGSIVSGELASVDGKRYPILDGIPRFCGMDGTSDRNVASFGDQWNFFNFTDFKIHWLQHTVANTFGSPDFFKGKVIVDAGGGSGAQSLWMLEYGAAHVIMLELSHSVDDVVKKNIDTRHYRNFDVIQCSIDNPPIREESIPGIVYCHNVIQHTPSVEKTATALFRLVAPGGEFVFNCYPLNDEGWWRWIRFHAIYSPLRALLKRQPFNVTLAYARLMGVLRLLPAIGYCVEKLDLSRQGDVPRIEGEPATKRLARRYRSTVLNTFDKYGAHTYQHHKSNDEVRSLVKSLQPDQNKVKNVDKYFMRPQPIGCALRVIR